MILFGAGSSAPFDIPCMVEFTESFVSQRDSSPLITLVKEGISRSDSAIGTPFPFDLETLLSVLNDLSGMERRKPISIPTASILVSEGLNLKQAQEKFGKEATSTLHELRKYIFDICMEPIKKGRKEGYSFLDQFYGPLMTMLNMTSLDNLQGAINDVYSTNWDLCFKQWADYVSLSINDATGLDKQSNPVLDISKIGTDSPQGFTYVPLHGSLDLVKLSRPKGHGTFEDIHRIPDPIGYFENKPDNLRDLFLIYPLEAVGYEESVRSPYLDMLIALRSKLRSSFFLFIIGYSLRDPTIGSILEEVVAERIRNREMRPLSPNLENRAKESSQSQFKIIVFSPNPEQLAQNLERQGFANVLNTFIPIKVTFPKVSDPEFKLKYSKVLGDLFVALQLIGFISPAMGQRLVERIRAYGFSI